MSLEDEARRKLADERQGTSAAAEFRDKEAQEMIRVFREHRIATRRFHFHGTEGWLLKVHEGGKIDGQVMGHFILRIDGTAARYWGSESPMRALYISTTQEVLEGLYVNGPTIPETVERTSAEKWGIGAVVSAIFCFPIGLVVAGMSYFKSRGVGASTVPATIAFGIALVIGITIVISNFGGGR